MGQEWFLVRDGLREGVCDRSSVLVREGSGVLVEQRDWANASEKFCDGFSCMTNGLLQRSYRVAKYFY
jgi:hypothetical protein